jgi:hypothetical protein
MPCLCQSLGPRWVHCDVNINLKTGGRQLFVVRCISLRAYVMFFQKGDAYTGKIANRALTKQYGQGKTMKTMSRYSDPSSYSCWIHMFSSTVKSAKEVPLHLASCNDIGSPNSAQSKSNLGAFTVHPSAKLSLETQESVVVCMCACMVKHQSNFKK